MKLVISDTFDSSLDLYEKAWLETEGKEIDSNNLSLTFYTSMVYGFAKHLPYSMDIEQEEYVPADFFNMMPFDIETNKWFKWEDRRTFFNSMISWDDTFKSGMLLQICNVFQKMLLGQFPNDYELKEEDYYNWKINELSKDSKYNRCFFETLKCLPLYYDKVMSAKDNNERRNALDTFYKFAISNISQRVGGFKQTDNNGNVVRKSNPSVHFYPYKDVDMRVCWDCSIYYDGIPSVIEIIKRDQLSELKSINEKNNKAKQKTITYKGSN